MSRSKLNSARMRSCPALASLFANSESFNTRRILLERARGSLGGTSNPFTPSSMISGFPPTLVATTGSPAAIDSRSEFGNPSDSEGRTERSQQAKSSGISLRYPRKSTFFSSPSALTFCSSFDRSGPSPISRKTVSGKNAANSMCCRDEVTMTFHPKHVR